MLAQARNGPANEVHLGDARFLITHSASTTHRQLSEAQQVVAGATPEAVRLSIGMETADDRIRDLDQALDARV